MFKFLGLVLVLFCTSFAYATPQAYFKYAINSQGEPQLKVRGVDLCDSQTYRIRVTDDLTGDGGWYTSQAGNTEWKINSRACSLDMFLAKKYLVPGFTLEVRTYAASGRRLHTFSATIPCEETRWVTEFSDQVVYETAIASPVSCSEPVQSPPVVVQPPQGPPPLSCDASAVKDTTSADLAVVVVSCNQTVGANVSAYDVNGNLLCANSRFLANGDRAPVCGFPRDRNRKLRYKIRVNAVASGALVGEYEGTIVKDATYLYPPQGTLLSNRYVQPPTQNKALGRGQYWDVSLKAQVSDADVDSSENQDLIKVELIEVVGGVEHVIKSTRANSGQAVQFDLEHQYIVPKVFGKPHESGDLHRGTNTLKVRVWDAYEGRASVDLPEVTVVIPN